MAKIDILGVPHAYELTAPIPGNPVLVFIHGWLLSRRYWQPTIARLSGEYQCLAYDLRGFGDSQPYPNPTSQFHAGYTPSAYARDLAILLETLDLSNVWLVGHSLGGSIALWGAAKAPDRVQGTICVNSGGGIYIKEEFERFRFAGRQLLKMRPRWLCHLPFIDLLFTRDSVARPIERVWARQRVVDFATAHPQAALGTLLDSTTEAEVHRLPQIVSQLEQPVYFIAGADDKVMEPKYVRHLASFHPLFNGCGENTIEIPECGHLSMVEKPEALVGQIREILKVYR
ncbi:alpha/beta fold hydrolase [Oxynema aestuarii]|uniref:Alpha/beta hydrolase n=1 Tax=Oxynema aestuarii AP17 TaxID=2064643 RepID=A0A6H1U2Q5_9CYAN|nr:alpha/beta hydrolase [Oxynema aestuarii]QIZ72935.1 alpha/beta hydrolase [Oxynema aestuarii AP17]RMH78510.1 MAG: alpha/beta hydrolase [Cyanobacteria bacterium J007]